MTTRPDDETKYAPNRPGVFNRGACRLQNWIAPGTDFPPEADRYHLFINYGCGWSHQAMLVRELKGLQKVVSMSHVGLTRIGGDRKAPTYVGWNVPADPTGNNLKSAYDIYNIGTPDYGREQMSIPILFDKKSKKVVSNDPAHMLLMFNSVFNEWAENKELDLYPEDLQEEIEKVNDVVYPGINDGVYRCWFADAEPYQESHRLLREALDWFEKRILSEGDYLCGHKLTLADVRAFPHLFRFDVIYHYLMLRDPRGPYLKETNPKTLEWMERIFQLPAFQEASDLEIATRFYLREPDDECDEFYKTHKLPWMPPPEALQEKRRAQGLVLGSVFKPSPNIPDLSAPC